MTSGDLIFPRSASLPRPKKQNLVTFTGLPRSSENVSPEAYCSGNGNAQPKMGAVSMEEGAVEPPVCFPGSSFPSDEFVYRLVSSRKFCYLLISLMLICIVFGGWRG